MIAADVMTREVITVHTRSHVAHALTVMNEHGIRHLPVVRDGGTLAGIVTEYDLRLFNLSRVHDVEGYERLRERLRAPVSEVMNSDVITVEPEADLTEVVDVMLEEKIGALPVVDPESDELVGIVSYVDVLRAARDSLSEQS